MILKERLQKEALPGRNTLHVPGKHSCFYSLQGIFTRNSMLLCFVLLSLEMGFRCSARIRISPSLAFWTISSGKAAGVGNWILIWTSLLRHKLRVCLEGGLSWCQPLHVVKHGGWQILSKKTTKPPAQYGYRFKLLLDPETLQMGCKATVVWL